MFSVLTPSLTSLTMISVGLKISISSNISEILAAQNQRLLISITSVLFNIFFPFGFSTFLVTSLVPLQTGQSNNSVNVSPS